MQLPSASRTHAGPLVACSDPPPVAGVRPWFALERSLLITEPKASTTPEPVPDVLPPFIVRAVEVTRNLTWFGVRPGLRLSTSAATPDTRPVANDEPEPLP